MVAIRLEMAIAFLLVAIPIIGPWTYLNFRCEFRADVTGENQCFVV
jgi:hypothetical protein